MNGPPPPEPTPRIDEFRLIEEVFAPLAAGAPGAFGLTDDAAAMRPRPGFDMVVTSDMMVAGVHFRIDDPAASIARKLLRANLSDLAAMGARPLGYLLAIAIPPATGRAWIEDFAAGLGADQESFAVPLLGGDTVAGTGPFTAAITALGEVAEGHALRRAGARAGDAIYISGSAGDAALGLMALQGRLDGLAPRHRDYLAGRYHIPRPRLALGAALVGVAPAAIDVSDGVMADLAHLCAASGVGAVVEAAAVPLSDAARAALRLNPDLREVVLTGGDDYEIIFAAPFDAADEIARLGDDLNLNLSRIGYATEAESVDAIDETGGIIALKRRGYRHRLGG